MESEREQAERGVVARRGSQGLSRRLGEPATVQKLREVIPSEPRVLHVPVNAPVCGQDSEQRIDS